MTKRTLTTPKCESTFYFRVWLPSGGADEDQRRNQVRRCVIEGGQGAEGIREEDGEAEEEMNASKYKKTERTTSMEVSWREGGMAYLEAKVLFKLWVIEY